MTTRFLFSILTTAAILISMSSASAQEKNEAPAILMANPVSASPGVATKVVLRGQRFDGATAVKASDPNVAVKIVGQGNAAFPNTLKAEKVGDRQIEIELTVPAAAPPGELSLVVVTPKGESAPYKLLLGGEFPSIEEKEPNDGFPQAQPVAVPQIVSGSIHGDKNVDVFVLEGTAGQKLVCEVIAARRGSALDAVLSLYDARGNLVGTHDDQSDSADAKLEAALPAAGKYYVVLQDANDLGGATHPYRLVVRRAVE